jgi:hypothetical protein
MKGSIIKAFKEIVGKVSLSQASAALSGQWGLVKTFTQN